jgi:hypothetical protein
LKRSGLTSRISSKEEAGFSYGIRAWMELSCRFTWDSDGSSADLSGILHGWAAGVLEEEKCLCIGALSCVVSCCYIKVFLN